MTRIIALKRAQGRTGSDMLSMLLASRDESGGTLTDDEVIGHVGVIFAAGHETSANPLLWTLFLLSQHPQIACDLVDELKGVLHGEPPTTEQLTRLPLLDCVVKESLRVLPPVPIHPRHICESGELQGYTLPAGSEIFVSIYHLHHDPNLFDDPQTFRPSRFFGEKPSPYVYNPFSAGPRMCIGAAFATLEIKIILAMLLQRFRIVPVPGRPINRRVAITMAPKPGLLATLHPADGGWQKSAGGIRGNIRELVNLPPA
jgi:cytochrome P450